MAGSTFGTIFRVSTWGESHGKGVGVVVDGCPAGLSHHRRRYPGIFKQKKTGTVQIYHSA